jgi:hypothetical protein
MSYSSPGESRDPDRDPNQPQQPYGQQPGEQPAAPHYPDPYGPTTSYGQQPGSAQYGQYGQPGYPAPPPYGQPQGTNIMAILSLVFAFVFSPVGIVLGHIAKKQIKQTGEQGDGLATAGLVLSYVFTGLGALACCIGVVAALASNGGSNGY